MSAASMCSSSVNGLLHLAAHALKRTPAARVLT
eukprot:CAMPEP_0174725528 /NCGR_PEP_ID=MMETSP1094-20130205/45834_1 /TAXON_ID=156173 /ORGANISM="Chrysochromulina brevifilum, Strain UTEX LB 985" /LENGTH=32 /DNA_ID= /DNA_START= /DNA_END= /DNA_ORIENTATION=